MQQELITDKDRVEVRWQLPAEQKPIYEQPKQSKTIRVAAYCRVSTDLEEQNDSFELQKRHYTQLICSTPGWHLVGIYADQGITGTQRSQRMGFQRMMRHCEELKIDRILCKSISRFARNTMDLLDTVRILKEQNISVIFEKEGIDTLSLQSEFVLSTIAAIAQEESRSISENMIWSFKKRFEQGIPVFKRILGYNIEGKGVKGRITINEEEAVIVREIYDLALKGISYIEIARKMMRKGYKTVRGGSEWTIDSVKGILINERYTGDVLCQKTYTVDYLSHKCKRNFGESPQYFIENHHSSIISHEVYEAVQKSVVKTKTGKTRKRNIYPLTGRVICGKCGATYHRYYCSNNATWRCSRSLKKSQLCNAERIRDAHLERIMLKGFEMRYDLKDNNVIHKLKLDIRRLQDEDNIERNRVILKRELTEALSNELHASIEEREVVKEKRIIKEGILQEKEQYWSAIEKDREYRTQTLEWLDQLPRGENRMTVFLEQLKINYLRAWVIGITVLSPFSFAIKWFDDTESMVDSSLTF